MSTAHPHLGPFRLLPKAKDDGKCDECATEHPKHYPHNQQSLFYQYNFYGKHGRWPTWSDAMAHCTEDLKAAWIEQLNKHGIEVPAEANP